MMRRHIRCVRVAAAMLALLAWAPGPASGQEEPAHSHAGHEHRLGTVVFPNSGSAAAQEPFLRGIALLHSFAYEDAEAAFRAARAADPSFALAYWAEALTHGRLLWGIEDTAAARRTLRELGPTAEARLARAGGERERAWGAAVEALYADADVRTRSRAFADSLRGLAAREGGDHEAAAFASIALQMAVQTGAFGAAERAAVRRAAIELADGVFRVNRNHPGAAHYLIHAYDDPELAPLGLEVARAYAQIAPDAQHALHMPSHIFVQVGLWDDAVASNERAWRASREWVAQRAASPIALDFHSLEWLQHAYLQQGRYSAARALMDTVTLVLRGVDVAGSVDANFVLQRLSFRYAAETRDWTTPLPPVPVEALSTAAESRYRWFRFLSLYQGAAGAILHGDTAAAARVAFQDFIEESSASAPPEGLTAAASLQIAALLSAARGDRAAAIEHMARAAKAEAAVPPVGPPALLPSVEWLGDMLLAEGRYAEAAEAYEQALRRWPNRSRSLHGLARARQAPGTR